MSDEASAYERLHLRRWRWVLLGLYIGLGLSIALLLRGIRFDDPFITYRFAENLAAGRGFVFNVGDDAPALLTTTPLYALLLAACRGLGLDIPTASHWIGGLALGAAACGLFLLMEQRRSAFAFTAGAVGGVCLLSFSLLWLTLGFETPLFIAVTLWAFVCISRGHNLMAGLLCGVALGLRGDGAIPFGIVGLTAVLLDRRPLWQRWRALLPICIGAAIIYAPLAIWLTMQFGSPVPSTLQTKSAQAISGLTGFYTGTGFAQAAWILIQAYIRQGGLFLVTLVMMAIGVAHIMAKRPQPYPRPLASQPISNAPAKSSAATPMLLPIGWLLLHFIGYSLIGVAPYVWYFAPMVPGLCVLIGLGLTSLWRRLHNVPSGMQRYVGTLWLAVVGVAVWASLLIGDVLVLQVIRGGTPPQPTLYESKVLPETKVDVYERVGRWISVNTPPTATLGVTELGVMSYYAHRHTVDFLGLTQPQHIADIRHGDFLAGLLREQPDYVAISAINAIYDVNPQKDAWFTQLYTRVATFADERFWGGPMTVWQRTQAPISTTYILFEGDADLGEGWRVLQVQSSQRDAGQANSIRLRLQLRAGKAIGNRTLRVQPVVLEGGDGLPVSSRLVYTRRWREGEVGWLDVIINPQPNPREGAYAIEAQWLEGGPIARVGMLKIRPNVNEAPALADVLRFNRASELGISPISRPVEVCQGSTPNVILLWRGAALGTRDYTVFLHVRDAANQTLAQGDGPPRNGGFLYPTSIWSLERIADTHAINLDTTIAAGTYDLVVGLYDPNNNERIPVDDAPYRTPDGGIRIGKIVVKSC